MRIDIKYDIVFCGEGDIYLELTVSSLEKLIKKILSGRAISYSEAERLLVNLGFKVKVTGSHHVFRKPGTSYNVSLKKRSVLLSYQIQLLQKVLIDHGYNENK